MRNAKHVPPVNTTDYTHHQQHRTTELGTQHEQDDADGSTVGGVVVLPESEHMQCPERLCYTEHHLLVHRVGHLLGRR